MANNYEIAHEIKSIVFQYLPNGKYNMVVNRLGKMLSAIRREERRKPVATGGYDDTPLFVETQEQATLRRLQAGETLDAMDGLQKADIRSMQLRTIVCRLRKKGWNIADRWKVLPSGKRSKEYWLEPDEEESATS